MVAVSSESGKRALFEHLIDDASLFPPAQLPLPSAIRAHLRHRESAYGWVDGRFVLPISRADEFAPLAGAIEPIALTVILDGTISTEAQGRSDFLDRLAILRNLARVTVPSLECVVASEPGAVGMRIATEVGERLPSDPIQLWIESSYRAGWPVDPASTLASVRAARNAAPPSVTIGAKVRCGGPRLENVPSPDDLAEFIVAAQRCGVPWKATAGLHHPVRGTYDGTVMHGFLNVFIAGIALYAGAITPDRVIAVLEEEDTLAFVVDPTHVAWRDARVDAETVAAARAHCVAFGSCSFAEPVNGLRALGILG
jgi:hypothetical protein